jgi:hypothetical protein
VVVDGMGAQTLAVDPGAARAAGAMSGPGGTVPRD